MAPKANKGKGVASSSHGNKRSRMGQGLPNENTSMPPQPPRNYRVFWITKEEGECNSNIVRDFLENWDLKDREATISLKNICAYLVLGKHVTHVMKDRIFLVYALMTGRPIIVGVIIKDVLTRERVKKGQWFSFGGLLTGFLREQQIDEEVVDYIPRYDSKCLDVMKIKEN
ncbi:hypothetical protein HAX54_047413 [Datura stramonium]|uniref:Uncharacterized protein n=1 Tax=Datura stramonium TaxID=4076 RepID=A0ABS8WKJ2_DATST|nr:hypothetical protein [Datura stramonium]